MSESSDSMNREPKPSEPRYILRKLLIGFDLILLTGLVAYGLLLALMALI